MSTLPLPTAPQKHPLDSFFQNVLGYAPGNGGNGSNIVTVEQLHQALDLLVQNQPMNYQPLTPVD